jgi:hypothetical protein
LILSNIRALPLLQLTGGSDRRRREEVKRRRPTFMAAGSPALAWGVRMPLGSFWN